MAYDGMSEHTQRIDAWPETGGDMADDELDRLTVHVVWELVLAAVLIVVAVVIYQFDSEVLVGPGLPMMLLSIAALGLLTVGMSWSLRAAVPNLAVGPIALAAALFFAQRGEGDLLASAGVTLGAAVTVGVLLSIVVALFHVPAWAASLVAAMAMAAWAVGNVGSGLPEQSGYDPASHALHWFVGFAAASLVGGMLGLYGPLRRGVSAYRPQGDPAERPGFGPALGAMAAIIGSCLFAAVAGVLWALMSADVGAAGAGLDLTGLALGAALIGGVSAYGRRGGLTGTLLAVVLLTLVIQFGRQQEWGVPLFGYAAVAVLVGLAVTCLVEWAGQPKADEAPDPWDRDDAWRPGSDDPAEPNGVSPGALTGDVVGAPDPRALPPATGHGARSGDDRLTGAIGDRAGRLSGRLSAIGETPLPPRQPRYPDQSAPYSGQSTPHSGAPNPY